MTTYTVSAGQTSSGITLSSGDTMKVLAGGTAVDTTIDTGGRQTVSAGGLASGTTIDGGTQVVEVGGIADLTVVYGGQQTLDAGGTASGTTIYGGEQLVKVGGIASGTTISGGEQLDSGTASRTTIDSGGEQIVASGTAITTTIANGGEQIVGVGGTASNTAIDSGGVQDVSGTAINTRIARGGNETVESGGTDSGATIRGVQLDEGTANGATIFNGGEQIVDFGTASGTTISGGEQVVVSGTADNTTILGGGTQVLASGDASGTTINGGLQEVFGTANDTTISNGGQQQVESGGVASGTVLDSDASQTVLSGGTASATTIGASDSETVDSGGTTANPVISGGTLDVQSGGFVSGTVTFEGHSGTLQIDAPGTGGALINGAPIVHFVSGNTIDLTKIVDNAGTTDQFVSSGDGGTLTIYEGGTPTATLTFSGTYNTAEFKLTPDNGGTDITTTVPCYCRGTLILTERGEVAVEELAIGDRVVTRDRWMRPIKWIGRRSYSGRFIAGNPDILPIEIKAGALGDGLPRRDLSLSPEHALYLDGGLIPARYLVNGLSIVQAKGVEAVEYFHIDLGTHDVIFAEGAAAESFIDDDSRLMFHNAAEFYARYPEAAQDAAARFCAPRIEDGWELEAVQQRLRRQAQEPAAAAVRA